MGWRSAERTLKAYEHVARDASFVTTTLTTIHAAMKKREDAIKKDPAALSRYQPVESACHRTSRGSGVGAADGSVPMTSQEIARRIQADLGPTWPRNRTLPDDVLAPLCEALWEEGVSPESPDCSALLAWLERARNGYPAWSPGAYKKGLPQQGVRGPRAVPTNAAELAKIVSPAIASAPQTCFDPANDGRWLTPSLTVLAYLGRIENQSVRDAMALFAILRADRQQFSMRNQIANFTYIMRRVMIEQSIEDVSSIDANDLLFRIHVGEVGKGLTDHQRRTLIGQWSAVRNVYEEYAEKLTTEQLEKLSRFFIKPLTDRRKLARHTPWAGVHREQQERVKNKTDAVQQQFYRVRYVAGIRCNQVRRLYAAATETIAFVEKNHRSYPHDFHYEETVQTPGGRSVRQRVELTLWDAVSVREHATRPGISRGIRNHATETLA